MWSGSSKDRADWLQTGPGGAGAVAQRTPSAWGERPPARSKAGNRCYDCKSPERICRGLVGDLGRPTPVETMEVVLIGEELGM
ncbi:MAG: hypothetical protein ACLRX4_04975 [Oscillospiraceae bacterium]